MEHEEFQATVQARELAGDNYANYIQKSLIEYIEKNIRSLEETKVLTLGDLFIGNEGE